MHDTAPAEPPPPPTPPVDHHHHHQYSPNDPLPDYPPPSYDDATRSATAPLLVGAPRDYGAFQAYIERDESSIASSEVEATDKTWPEWFGQAFVVIIFVAFIYGFWSVINTPDNDLGNDIPGHPG